MSWIQAKKDTTWKPSVWMPKNAGDAIEGEYLEIMGRSYRNVSKNSAVTRQYLRVRNQVGTIRLVQYHQIIRMAFADLKIQQGEKIKIVYTGKKINNRLHDYDVYVDRQTPATKPEPVVSAGKK